MSLCVSWSLECGRQQQGDRTAWARRRDCPYFLKPFGRLSTVRASVVHPGPLSTDDLVLLSVFTHEKMCRVRALLCVARGALPSAVTGDNVAAMVRKWRATAEGFGVDLEEVVQMTSVLRDRLSVSEDAMRAYAVHIFALFDVEQVRASVLRGEVFI